MNKNNKMIREVKNLCKTYYSGKIPLQVLRGVDLSLQTGQIIAIVGESGCGKSTLLNLIGGLDSITSGSITVKGNNVEMMDEDRLAMFRNEHIGFVFQFHHLLPDFTAVENVMLPYLAKRFNKQDAQRLALALLKEVNLTHRIHHLPAQLSGGEQQRVAIARALINKPSIILADEPTGNLDEKTSEEVRQLLWGLREKHQLTILLVTHNEGVADMSDYKVKLAYGRIV